MLLKARSETYDLLAEVCELCECKRPCKYYVGGIVLSSLSPSAIKVRHRGDEYEAL